MVQVERSADCGNSPKNQFAEELIVALLSGDVSTIESAGALDICSGQMTGEPPTNIQIEHVVTHGKVGAVSGTVTLSDGLSAGFCFVLEFATAKADRLSKVIRYSL